MRLGLLTLLLFGWGQFAFASSDTIKSKWTVFGGFSFAKAWHVGEPFVLNNPFFVGPYSALPISGNSLSKPALNHLRYKSSFLVKVDAKRRVGENGFFSLGLSAFQAANSGGTKRLRFIDMIDPERGFVKPSIRSISRIYYTSRFLDFNVGYGIHQVFKSGYQHQITAHIHIAKLYQSQYLLELNGLGSDHGFFWSKDIKPSEDIYAFYPSFSYAFNMPKYLGKKCWLELEFSQSVMPVDVNCQKLFLLNKKRSYAYEPYSSSREFMMISLGARFQLFGELK